MKIDTNVILGFDIETAPLDGFGEDHPCFDCWENKCRKENLDIPQLIEKFNKEAGLFAEYSRIVCLSLSYIYEGKLITKSLVGTEQEIIDDFIEIVTKFNIKRRGIQFLGHNIQNFDIPYVRKAYARYHPMFEFPECMTDLFKKPWENSNWDTLQIHKGSAFMFSSMAEVAMMLGLPSPKTDTDGSMVADLFKKGEIERIKTYCEGDVYTSWCILMKWMGLPMPEKMEVNPKEDPIEAAKNIPIIAKILSGAKITKADKDKLTKALAKYEGTPELQPILQAIEFVNKDFSFTTLTQDALN